MVRGRPRHAMVASMNGVDFNLLAVFEAIVRTRSVRVAAEEAGISKAAMSHALGRLRRELGDLALVRIGNEWQLSERALTLRSELCELAVATRRLLSAPTAFEPATAEREFRIHATDHMLSILGAPLGYAASKEAPGIALRFLPIAPDDASPLRDGRADLALGFFRELPAELRTQSLFDDRLACVVRRGQSPRRRRESSRDRTQIGTARGEKHGPRCRVPPAANVLTAKDTPPCG